eukprot:COSAG04_NODE_761_length_10520_cov_3.835428_2_plen_106_part_00
MVHPDIHPLERIKQWGEQIEKNEGKNAMDYMNRGVAFQEQGMNEETEPQMKHQRQQESEADYKKSIELDPTVPSTHYNLGNLQRRASRWCASPLPFLLPPRSRQS